jgi:LysR family glycine cleavage system transcriptional activator/LysR family transcriptional regulator of beta-lactamase
MARHLPFLNGLRAFEAAARRGSFTAAAAELHVTQAAVSQQVQLLEERLGFTLFRRRANRLELYRSGSGIPAWTDRCVRCNCATDRGRSCDAAELGA